MAKKGISRITGPSTIKLGETQNYRIIGIYSADDDDKVPHAKWILYVKENTGWRELKPVQGTPPKIGSETTLTITNQNLLGKELLLEAYLYQPEKTAPPGMVIRVDNGERRIERVDLFRTDDTKIEAGEVINYGQSIVVKLVTLNMPNETITLSLYEDDDPAEGHSTQNER